jgi:asparagine synthase (glutamine-hydrolysing)
MKLAALFSGGKDSVYAMYKLRNKHKIACLITLKSKRPDSYMFHYPNIELTKVQAKLMNIPIIFHPTSGVREKELMDLKRALQEAKKKYKIKGVVTGAIASSYQRMRVEKICRELNLKPFSPLWQIDQEKYLEKLYKDKFEIIITGIGAYGLNKDFLAKRIDKEFIRKLQKINDDFPINFSGEGGEFESFVLNCPLFSKRIKVKRGNILMEREYTGRYLIKEIELR